MLPSGYRQHLICMLGVMLFVASVIAGCSHMVLPPIVDSPTGQKTPGAVVWHDLITSDVALAKKFYGDLLGWQFQEAGEYTLIMNQAVPIGGMVEYEADTDAAAGWVVYFSMEDIKDTAAWVSGAQGNVLKGPSVMTNRGEYALIADPTGAESVILDSVAGDPAGRQVRTGDWLWNELWTTDVQGALGFYQNLCKTAAQQVGEPAALEYWVLIGDEEAYLGGIAQMPFENMKPSWVPVVRVDDVARVAEQVPLLGGEVVVTPDHPLSGESIALIRDPVGGIFMVEAWSDEKDE